MQGGGRHGIAQEQRRIRAGGVVKSWGMVGRAGRAKTMFFVWLTWNTYFQM